MCIFCKIANKEISSNIIYEDDYTIAFLDIEANTYAHALVVPKNHVKNLLDCDYDTYLKVMNTVYKVVEHYKNVLNIESVNIINNSGEDASQTVFHLHYHIIPKYSDNSLEEFKLNFSDIINKLKM